MLNLYKNYKKKFFFKNNEILNKIDTKYFPASTREWNNSIYTYNKNYISLLPSAKKLTAKLVRSYFSLYNSKLENYLKNFKFFNNDKILSPKLRIRFRKISSNKIFVSKGTYKHTNNKVIITLFIYNRQIINYSHMEELKIFFSKKMYLNLTELFSRTEFNILHLRRKINLNTSILISLLNNEDIEVFKENKILQSMLNNLLKKYRRTKDDKLNKKAMRYFYFFMSLKQLLFINKSKFNFNFLNYLNFLLKKVFNKSIQFNIINLKSFFLNSEIFTESILLNIKRNRKKLNKKLRLLMLTSKINKINKPSNKQIYDLLNLNSNNTESLYKPVLNNLFKIKRIKKGSKNLVLSLIKYKKVVGVRLQAKGRLTKRYSAARSLSKLKYKGNLINLDSSKLKKSSVYLRGNLRPNLQYTNLNSKTRIGSFGLKGWVSGY